MNEPYMWKFVNVMETRHFIQSEYLCCKGDKFDVHYIIKNGQVHSINLTIGECKYKDQIYGL